MNKWPHLAGIGFSIVFGFSFMFTKKLYPYISPMAVIAYRFLIAFAVFELLRRFKIVHIDLKKRKLIPILIVALLQPGLYFIFEVYGVDLTSSAEAGLMIALIPIFVTIFGAFILKEKPLRIQILFILMSFIGVLVIQIFKPSSSEESSILGFALLLMAVISAALFNIASRSASKSFKPQETTYFMMMFGAVSFNIIYVIQLTIDKDIKHYFTYLGNIKVILPLLYLGVVASILGFFLVNYALSKLQAHVSSIYANISTIVAVIAGYLFLDEAIGIFHIVGGALIITGVYGTARFNKSSRLKRLKNDSTHTLIS